MKQQREILRKEKETAEKIAARAFAQSYLADLVPSVFGTLSDNGYFYDPVERGNHMYKIYFNSLSKRYSLCICILPYLSTPPNVGALLKPNNSKFY